MVVIWLGLSLFSSVSKYNNMVGFVIVLSKQTQSLSRLLLSSSIKLWNNIPNDIRLNPSKCCLKQFFNRKFSKKSYYFNFGSRKEQIIFARLHLRFGSLKDHLFQKNIIDSWLCTWGKIETTVHYLLQCPNYIFIRNETMQTLGTCYLKMCQNTLLEQQDLIEHTYGK